MTVIFSGGGKLPAEAGTLLDLMNARARSRPNSSAYTFLSDPGDPLSATTVTNDEVDHAARVIAADLVGQLRPGDHAILLYPPGLDYIAALLACFRARIIAVPAFQPTVRSSNRIRAIIRDAAPAVMLTTKAHQLEIGGLLGGTGCPPLLTTRPLNDAMTATPPPVRDADNEHSPDEVAFLQYTSGSTAMPRGVMVTHRNVVANAALTARAFEIDRASVIVSWLPLYHDMGLMAALQQIFTGAHVILMSPFEFLKQPIVWLAAIAHFRGTVSAAPNFAYDLCVERTTAEQRAALDLCSWRTAINGSEPVRVSTLDRFASAFGASGFAAETMRPCYGLAEATVLVTGGPAGRAQRILNVDAKAFNHRAVVSASMDTASSRRIIGCGCVWPDAHVEIVDSGSGQICSPSQVGEVWVTGANVAAGYWGRPDESTAVFGARLPNDPRPYLRTGDLGFVDGGELFIAGRLKDLIILSGCNYFPQDVEETAEASHPAVRRGCVAAVAVTSDDGAERLAVVAEVRPNWQERLSQGTAAAVARNEVVRAIRRAIVAHHGIPASVVALAPPGALPKTSSGKLRRREATRLLLDGELPMIHSVGVS